MNFNKSLDEKLKNTDSHLYELLSDANTLITSGYPALTDQRNSWNNKSAQLMEELAQSRSSYQFIYDETNVRIKTIEYKEYLNASDGDQYKSWNEKSLTFYNNNQLVDFYRQVNYYKFVINAINEVINIIKYMSR